MGSISCRQQGSGQLLYQQRCLYPSRSHEDQGQSRHGLCVRAQSHQAGGSRKVQACHGVMPRYIVTRVTGYLRHVSPRLGTRLNLPEGLPSGAYKSTQHARATDGRGQTVMTPALHGTFPALNLRFGCHPQFHGSGNRGGSREQLRCSGSHKEAVELGHEWPRL